MKALDTNVLVRVLVNDDKAQAKRAHSLFKASEHDRDRLFVTSLVVLETIWVLESAYDFTRAEILEALAMLTELPILEFEDYDVVQSLIALGLSTKADLSDVLIGLTGRSHGCEVTVTFEKGLGETGLFGEV